MDKAKLFENKIRIFYSNYNNIENKDTLCEILEGNANNFRFKDNKMIINQPSQVLHVANLKKEFCN